MGLTRRADSSPSVTATLTHRAPAVKPDFTVGSLRRAIPDHLFQPSLLRSSAYLALDLVVCAALFWCTSFIDRAPVPKFVAFGLLWPAYWFLQGAFGTGIWVIAHECGHGSFSKSAKVNDAVGLVLHSLLLVPYYSWKHSHRRHHQNTGSLENDEVFVPKAKPAGTSNMKLWDNPVFRLASLVVTFTLGWPLYLMFNTGGRPYARWANHFDPSSPIFKGRRERIEVVISDIALAVVLSGLAGLGTTFGWMWLVKMYVIPYLFVNHWLVMITFLQHTHPNLPHYDDKEWDWLRGALATVDRSYGFLDHVFHHIADTHVAHHLFSTLPHYHAQEATEAIKKVLGDYYAKDTRNVFRALWEDRAMCEFVVPDKADEHTYWFTH